MENLWDLISKVFVGVMTVGILTLVSLQWSTQQDMSFIRQDIAVIKSENLSGRAYMQERMQENSSRIHELAQRVRNLELEPRGCHGRRGGAEALRDMPQEEGYPR